MSGENEEVEVSEEDAEFDALFNADDDASASKAEAEKTDSDKDDADKADSDKEADGTKDESKEESDKAYADKADSEKEADGTKDESKEESDKADADKADADKADSDKADSDKADADKADSDKLDADLTRAAAEAAGHRLKVDEASKKGKSSAGETVDSRFDSKYLAALLEKVGDEKIITTGSDGKEREITLREMAKEYPEMLQSAAAMAKAIAGDSVASSHEQMRQIQAEISDLRFWNALTDPESGIPDARRIAVSKEFAEWVKKQPEDIQRLTESPNPDHAKLVIRAYKNTVAKAAAAKTDKKAVGLQSVRRAAAKAATPASVGGGKKTETDDFDEGFNAD